ncbi:MAG: hypothetical protein J3R72DRAFT_418446 [Linnemannia gamsii]|nr:MAG: hypothetical protein J3R72DRAFT_418446 [Linnemannia gamsii]
MVTPTTPNPFDIPELRHQLSQFVTTKTACSCARVSKTWTATFISVIWFEVDFAVHPRFTTLPRSIITKHGQFIRKVKNAKTFVQVSALTNPSIRFLRSLEVETTATVLQHEYAYEVVSRNNVCLQELDLYAATTPETSKWYSMIHYVSVPALVQFTGASSSFLLGQGGGPITSKLKTLTLTYLCLTQHGLVAILQASPSLTELRLVGTDIVGRSKRSFRHSGVTVLATWLKNIIQTDTDHVEDYDGPSLLAYFPSLQALHICDLKEPWLTRMATTTTSSEVTTTTPTSRINSRIKKVLTDNCPNLTIFQLQGETGAIIPQFCLNTPRQLTKIAFHYPHTTTETIIAILQHQSTLQAVSIFCMDNIFITSRDRVVAVKDHFRDSGHVLQLLPRSCPRLEVLSVHLHEMDMDIVERNGWICKGLRVLRVRIKELDTEAKISRALGLWYEWLKVKSRRSSTSAGERGGSGGCAGEGEGEEGMSLLDRSIEARVARHLLQFEKLETIWLGYKTWSLRG